MPDCKIGGYVRVHSVYICPLVTSLLKLSKVELIGQLREVSKPETYANVCIISTLSVVATVNLFGIKSFDAPSFFLLNTTSVARRFDVSIEAAVPSLFSI